jgi:hypothetical protein
MGVEMITFLKVVICLQTCGIGSSEALENEMHSGAWIMDFE